MKVAVYIVPVLLLALFGYAIHKKVRPYDAVTKGIKQAVPLATGLFPYLAATFMMAELFERSGLSAALSSLLSPVFRAVGIPSELSRLLLIKPFSGSGSLAFLSDVLQTHGADSLIARQACTVYGSSETVFYISAVYFAGLKNKHLTAPIVISLISGLVGSIVGCALCRVI